MPHTALEFSIAGARLALNLPHVVEVLPVVRLVKPPEMPRMLRGFVNVQGELIPVLRLEHLLQLDVSDDWQPEENLNGMIILARLGDLSAGWMTDGDARMLTYGFPEMVRLPADHVLNNCAEWVIARTPPEPSIVLIDPERLLLEKERMRLEELYARENERLAEAG